LLHYLHKTDLKVNRKKEIDSNVSSHYTFYQWFQRR